ncbi:ring-opening amidohydrolase, partial [Rhizobium brockwellii]|uniref:ring-opening amidohydrolase n=1 Tax=Rhizobium brockwellii TaxID=3019932 RepID=UPI003F945FCE
ISPSATATPRAEAPREIDATSINDADICTRFNLFSRCASTSSGVELTDHEIIVLGMSAKWSVPLSIDHAFMRDAIDSHSVRKARER